jgi:hypothetical protein
VTHHSDHNPLNDKVLDLVLGQLSADETRELSSQLAADPALAVERARVEGFLRASAAAHQFALEPSTADRVAARVIRQVRDEEAASTRAASRSGVPAVGVRRAFWTRVLALSVAAHAVILGVLAYTANERRKAPVEPFLVHEQFDVTTSSQEPLASRSDPAPLPLPGAYVVEPSVIDVAELPFSDDPAPMGPDIVVPGPSREAALLHVSGPAYWRRTNDEMKTFIFKRVGAPGSLATIRGSLAALASRQLPNGSFPASKGSSVEETTALALLPFLGDGSTSRFGERRPIVERGIEFLRTSGDAGVRGNAYALWALSEDYLGSRAFLTPSELRDRSAEIQALRARLMPADVAKVDRSSTLGHALVAASRVRFLPPPPSAIPAVATVNGWLSGEVTVDSAAEVASSILRFEGASGDADAFRRWSAKAGVSLRALLADDGLVRGDAQAREADRLADTARALVALQVPVRGE